MNAPLPVPDPLKVPPVKQTYPGIYKGIVVQRTDPQRLGRLRVRVEGIYTDIAVENLPWAWPCTPMSKKGGFFSVPPLDEYVWVMFENGMGDYPVWMGGWWGAQSPQKIETADGRDASAHIDLPTNNFGGQRWSGGPLKMESFAGLDEADQPNNHSYGTPLQKYWEFDDRKGLEKIKIADQLDNYFWINTQKGRATWELIQGLDADVTTRKYRGITLNNKDEVAQIYTFAGWRFTIDDKQGFMEICSPQRAKIKINEGGRRLECWTQDRHYLMLDDAGRSAVLETTNGRQIVMDDTNKRVYVAGAAKQSYFIIDENANTVEVRANGVLNLKGTTAVNISSNGPINIDGSQVLMNCGAINTTLTLSAKAPYSRPENAVQAIKADREQRGVIPQ